MMNDINEFVNELNSLFNENIKEDSKAVLKTDVLEYKDGYMILTDIPGVSKESIKLSYEDEYLTISVSEEEEDGKDVYKIKERMHNYKDKKISFKDVDFQNASAQYENGVLRLYIPKAPKNAKKIIIE